MTLPPPDLAPVAQANFENLTDEQKSAFLSYYRSQERSTVLMVVLAVLFPVQLFFLGKILLGIVFWLTGGGFGIWYIVEWFLTPGRVREYNAQVAADAFRLIESGKAAAAPEVIEEEE